MAKLNENESYVVKAAESLAKTVNDSAKYSSFMEQLKYLFDQYEMTKPGRDKIADRIYNILQKNGVDVAREIFDADMESLKTVDFIWNKLPYRYSTYLGCTYTFICIIYI